MGSEDDTGQLEARRADLEKRLAAKQAEKDRFILHLQTGHDVGVHVLAVAERKSPVGSLDLEPELLVQCDGGRIIGVYAEIQPRKAQPVVREVHASFHQPGADALALPVISYRYTEVS